MTTNRIKQDKKINPKTLLSTGCTPLNLAISGYTEGAIPPGRYVFFVGDSSSGKTMFGLSMLAEATINQYYKNHELIYYDAEAGALMHIEKFFGRKLKKRIEIKEVTHLEQVYFDLQKRFKRAKSNGRPIIAICDSMDALRTKYQDKKFQEQGDAYARNTEAKGDFGDGKAKINSQNIKRVIASCRDTNSIFVAICQTRDNINGGLFERREVFSGGRAIKFYAHCQVWTRKSKTIHKTVRGTKRQIGVRVRCFVEKNRISGKEWDVETLIYWSHGFSDIDSCIDYLLKEKHWKIQENKIIIPEFNGYDGRREDVIRWLQEDGLENEVRKIVGKVWKEIERQCTVSRKSRYA